MGMEEKLRRQVVHILKDVYSPNLNKAKSESEKTNKKPPQKRIGIIKNCECTKRTFDLFGNNKDLSW
jgi:hypothetical protein